MVPNFDFWLWWGQNNSHINERRYSTPSEFYPNKCLRTGNSKASHKGLGTARELVQELKKEQEV